MALYPEGQPLGNSELMRVAPVINPWTEIMTHMAAEAQVFEHE